MVVPIPSGPLVGALGLDVAGLLALVADALGARGRAVLGEMAVLTTCECC